MEENENNETQEWTVRHFVRDLCLQGRSDAHVRAVAFNTHWKTQMQEVNELLASRGERWRAKGARA